MQILESAIDNIRENSDDLFAAEKIVARHILDHAEQVPSSNIKEIAVACGVSEATVIRMCKHLGYKGFYQLKLMLAQDLEKSSRIGAGVEDEEILDASDFFKGLSHNIYAVGKSVDIKALHECVPLIAKANVVHIIAFGNTITTALNFAFRLGRIEISTTSSISDELELSSINLARYGDIVIGLSHSGGSRSVLKAFQLARQKGITTIAITDIIDTPLHELADYTLATGVEKSRIEVFGAESHVYMSAILDALFYFLAKEKRTKKGLAMFLAETKIEVDDE